MCLLTGVFIKNWRPRFFVIRSNGPSLDTSRVPLEESIQNHSTTSRLKVGECRHVWVGVVDKSTGGQVVNTGTICTIA